MHLHTRKVDSLIPIPSQVNDMIVLPDVVVTGCTNHRIYIWTHQFKLKQTLRRYGGAVLCLARTPTGFASGSDDTTIKLWERPSDEYIHVRTLTKHAQPIAALTTFGGTVMIGLVSGGYKRDMFIWGMFKGLQ